MSVHVFEEMIGATIQSIDKAADQLSFRCVDGRTFQFCHFQECCENVEIEDVIGDLDDLIGTPLTMAEEVSNMNESNLTVPEWRDTSYTWTFYRFGTNKGEVTVRWFGTSNGYYSESVDFEVIR